MAQSGFEYRFKRGRHPADGGAPGPRHVVTREAGMLIERDIAVPMRDGAKIFIDLYHPDHAANVPALVAWGPYGKHNVGKGYGRFFDNGGVKDEWYSKYAMFEAPDPVYWVGHDYAVVHVDPRGTWYSEGDATYWSQDEARDYYDLIEWLAVQPWCNGKVGGSGVSYLAIAQWQVAALRPPHLAAINPCEGYSDSYRERAFHGGIQEDRFMPMWLNICGFGTGRMEDVEAMMREHPFYDAYWQTKTCDLSKIEVPAYVIASWSDQGLHTRGTLEAYKQMSSKHKWLEVHGRRKWEYFLRPDIVEKQRVFFDHFLKGTDDAVLNWPRVNIEVRDRYYVGQVRNEAEWPLARTNHKELYLDAQAEAMNWLPTASESKIEYDGETGSATFDHSFAAETELTGHMKLKLWVEAERADDMDLFVALLKLDADGEEVPFAYFSVFKDGPVALGWLRVSHRELDLRRSTPAQPWHPHLREQRLAPGEIVPVEIEILASSTVFHEGERLRVVVRGHDFFKPSHAGQGPIMEHITRNRGGHIIHTGGQYDSHLLVPVIPGEDHPIGT